MAAPRPRFGWPPAKRPGEFKTGDPVEWEYNGQTWDAFIEDTQLQDGTPYGYADLQLISTTRGLIPVEWLRHV